MTDNRSPVGDDDGTPGEVVSKNEVVLVVLFSKDDSVFSVRIQ